MVDSGVEDKMCVMMMGGGVAVTERGARMEESEEVASSDFSFDSPSLTTVVGIALITAVTPPPVVLNNTFAKMGAFCSVVGIG